LQRWERRVIDARERLRVGPPLFHYQSSNRLFFLPPLLKLTDPRVVVRPPFLDGDKSKLHSNEPAGTTNRKFRGGSWHCNVFLHSTTASQSIIHAKTMISRHSDLCIGLRCDMADKPGKQAKLYLQRAGARITWGEPPGFSGAHSLDHP